MTHDADTMSAGSIAPRFRADIQGMRALAVLIVVLYHIDLVPGGYVGVDAFFVISGFLMGGLLLREADETGRVSLRNFFTRRSRRLLPALAVTVLATLVIAFFVAPARGDFRTANQTATGTSLFIANVRLFQLSGDYFAPIAERNPLLHTWSLSVEEQFYFAFPLVVAAVFVLLGRRRLVARRTLVGVIAAAGIVSLALSIAFIDGFDIGGISRLRDFSFFSPLTRVWEFAAGILLAAWLMRRPARSAPADPARQRVVNTLGALAGAAAIVVPTVLLDDTTPFPGAAALIPVLGTVLLLAAAPRAAGVGALLSSRPAVVLGDLSYGWYLWHWPIIVFTRAIWGDAVAPLVGAALVSLGLAAVSYRFVEERFRRDQRIVGRRAVALAVCCILIPVAVSLVGDRIGRTAEDRLNRRYDLRRPDPPATPSTDDGRLRVTLVGDSHARVLIPALAPLFDEAGIHLRRLTRTGCQFLVGVSSNLTSCRSWQERTMRALLDDPPDVVVMAGYTVARTTEIIAGKRRPIPLTAYSGRRARTEAEALELYDKGLSDAVERLTDAGITIILISSVPDFWTTPFDHVSAFDVLTGRDTPTNEQRTIEEIRQRTGGILDIESRIATTNPAFRVIDPVPVLCSTVCQQVENSTVVYRDHSHVAHAGAIRLAEAVLAEIRSISTVTP